MTRTDRTRIVVAITGASGAAYGVRAIEMLHGLGVETHVIISRWGRQTLRRETTIDFQELVSLATDVHHVDDLGAELSSGSFRTDGMIVAPCSMRALAAIAIGLDDDLIVRAASVTLKERRRLVLMVRETPLTAIHLDNMSAVTRAGAVVFPPVPALYTGLESIAELIDYSVVRALDLFGLDAAGALESSRWQGMHRGGHHEVAPRDV